jgi:hypothetical protein
MAKLTLDVAKEIARSRGGECISERYVNCQIPMLWKCAKDHLWSARLTSVKNEKTWCPWYTRHTQTIEDMRKFAENKGSLCLATEYVNRRDHHVKKAINERLQQRIFLRKLGVEDVVNQAENMLYQAERLSQYKNILH